jgi:hypothetical protein
MERLLQLWPNLTDLGQVSFRSENRQRTAGLQMVIARKHNGNSEWFNKL